MKWAFAGFGLGLSACSGTAYAQVAENSPARVDASASETAYTPGFYARYAPRSALDMVEQTPGFTIAESADQRGLGQGGANVLINSQRISSKATSARDALSRIAAERVVRIEVLDGARLSIPGLSGYVVNVVTTGGAPTGRWEWSPEFRPDRRPWLERGQFVVSGETNGWNYTTSLSTDQTGESFPGYEIALDDTGTPFDVRIEDEDQYDQRLQASLDLSYTTLNGSVANLRVLLSEDDNNIREFSDRTGTRQPDRSRFFRMAEQGDEVEVGGDFEIGLGPGHLKLIGLHQTRANSIIEGATTDFFGVRPTIGSRVDTDSTSGESILRSEYSLGADDVTWQVSLEAAFNYLDTNGAAFVLSGQNFVEVSLAGATSRIEERRAEAALVHGQPLTDQLTVQASLGAEYSELTQIGANGLTREFVRPKGFVALAWTPSSLWDASFRVERAVGQLDFADFVTSVNLNLEQGQTTGGNPELVPEQSWDTELVLNGRLGWAEALKLRLYYRSIEDVNDQVLISRTVDSDGTISVLEAAGNLDGAVDYGVEVSGTFNLSQLLPGAKLDWLYFLGDSRVDDPVTSLPRMLNQVDWMKANVRFRQDFPNSSWAWGAEFASERGSGLWRIGQRAHRIERPGGLDVFVQNKNLFGIDAQLRINNLLDDKHTLSRLIYSGTRTDPLSLIEERTRHRGYSVELTLSGSF